MSKAQRDGADTELPYYMVSGAKPTRAREMLDARMWDEPWSYSTGKGDSVTACPGMFEALTGIILEPGSKPVRMRLELTPWEGE